jgi:hypothetical protein
MTAWTVSAVDALLTDSKLDVVLADLSTQQPEYR